MKKVVLPEHPATNPRQEEADAKTKTDQLQDLSPYRATELAKQQINEEKKVPEKKKRSTTYKSFWSSFVGGAGAGAVAAFFTSPLDVIKTRMQVQSSTVNKYTSILQSVRVILAEEGMAGFYRGLPPTLFALIPNWAIYFWTYNGAKAELQHQFGWKEDYKLYVVASVTAATITNVVTNPLWLVKTRMQTEVFWQGENFDRNSRRNSKNSAPTASASTNSSKTSSPLKYTSTWRTLQTIVHEEGVLKLWTGLVPQFIGLIHVAIQFPVYETLKKFFMKHNDKSHKDLTLTELFISSAVSKLIASTAAYPHEVLRSKLQSQHSADPRRFKGVIDIVQKTWATDGLKGFYRGLSANLFRTVPAAALTLTTYELITKFFDTMKS